MFEKEHNHSKEAETVCLLTTITMNLLLLTIICGAIWSVYSVFENTNFFRVVTFGKFLS